ncbi:DUF6966 domain-containing protein [Phyllobacterium sp. K27]
MFGGMGSFNDLILQQNLVMLVPENEKLNTLRSQAWKLGKELATEI